MASPITIYKNNNLLYEAKNIQEAADFYQRTLIRQRINFMITLKGGMYITFHTILEKMNIALLHLQRLELTVEENVEERGHKNARRFWLMPANPNDYDVEGAFSYYDTIDWKRSYNYENGDIIFIYVSGNIQKVRYKVEVIEGLVRNSDITYDDSFWLDEEKYNQSQEYDRSRIRLIDEVDTSDLSLVDYVNMV